MRADAVNGIRHDFAFSALADPNVIRKGVLSSHLPPPLTNVPVFQNFTDPLYDKYFNISNRPVRGINSGQTRTLNLGGGEGGGECSYIRVLPD